MKKQQTKMRLTSREKTMLKLMKDMFKHKSPTVLDYMINQLPDTVFIALNKHLDKK